MESHNASSKLLYIIGLLWLTAGIGLLIYQLTNPAQVEIKWETATELQTAGFNLYRSTSANGEFIHLNPGQLIPSQGSVTSGASYTFVDEDVEAGETYYYLLEEIELNARANRYEDDIFTYEVPRVIWPILIATAVFFLVGFALLIAGFREGRT